MPEDLGEVFFRYLVFGFSSREKKSLNVGRAALQRKGPPDPEAPPGRALATPFRRVIAIRKSAGIIDLPIS